MAKKTVAERLKKMRELAGLSQFALASRTGIDRTTISYIENGHVVPRPEQIATIEKVCRDAITNAVEEMRAAVPA